MDTERIAQWFSGRGSQPNADTAGRLVFEATADGGETVRSMVTRGLRIALLFPLGAAFAFGDGVEYFALLAAAFVIEGFFALRTRHHDIRFHQHAVHGHFKEDGRTFRAGPKPMLHRYADLREIRMERDGRLVVQLTDPRTLMSRTFVGHIPESKRALADDAVRRLQSASELRLPDVDPREWPRLTQQGW